MSPQNPFAGLLFGVHGAKAPFGTSLLLVFRDEGGKGIGFFKPHGILVSSIPSLKASMRINTNGLRFDTLVD
jgi:hypothetical protein